MLNQPFSKIIVQWLTMIYDTFWFIYGLHCISDGIVEETRYLLHQVYAALLKDILLVDVLELVQIWDKG